MAARTLRDLRFRICALSTALGTHDPLEILPKGSLLANQFLKITIAIIKGISR
jgi:hypothetical protein